MVSYPQHLRHLREDKDLQTISLVNKMQISLKKLGSISMSFRAISSERDVMDL